MAYKKIKVLVCDICDTAQSGLDLGDVSGVKINNGAFDDGGSGGPLRDIYICLDCIEKRLVDILSTLWNRESEPKKAAPVIPNIPHGQTLTTTETAKLVGMEITSFRSAMARARKNGVDLRMGSEDSQYLWNATAVAEYLSGRPGTGNRVKKEMADAVG